jgi:hypothetical protein
MIRKNLFLFYLLFFALGCTIIEDEYLDELPAAVKPSKIELIYRPYNVSEYGEKILTADVIHSANQVVVNWPQGVDVFFYNKNATKTVYQINSNGLADKITTTFADGTIIEDILTYNADKQVVELSSSFFKDNLKLFYKNNVLDSVAKTRTVNNVTQIGFYKRVSSTEMYSIFPFDNTKPYDKTFSAGLDCGSGGTLPANMNTFNKSELLNTQSEEQNTEYYFQGSLNFNYNVSTTSTNCDKYFTEGIYGYLNYYSQPSYYYFYFGECSLTCGNSINGYLNIYKVLPTLVPDFLTLNQLTAENELEWMVKNRAQENQDWLISELRYSYQPASK